MVLTISSPHAKPGNNFLHENIIYWVSYLGEFYVGSYRGTAN